MRDLCILIISVSSPNSEQIIETLEWINIKKKTLKKCFFKLNFLHVYSFVKKKFQINIAYFEK